MIGIIVHHYAISGREAEGIGLIQASGRAMHAMKGFRARHTLVAESNRSQITTVTFWESKEDYLHWMQSAERKKVARPSYDLWTQPPVPEFFEVAPERRM